MRHLQIAFTAAAAVFAAIPAFAQQQQDQAQGQQQEEQDVTMNSVPPAAKAAAMYAAAGFKLDEVQLDMDGGQATYEFSGKSEKGKLFEIDVLPDGRVVEVEMEIAEDEVPQKAMQLVNQHVQNFQPKMIERSVRTGDVVSMWYEMEGTDGSGQEVDVEVLGNGEVILIQRDLAG